MCIMSIYFLNENKYYFCIGDILIRLVFKLDCLNFKEKKKLK